MRKRMVLNYKLKKRMKIISKIKKGVEQRLHLTFADELHLIFGWA